jgi:hypothetical protein
MIFRGKKNEKKQSENHIVKKFKASDFIGDRFTDLENISDFQKLKKFENPSEDYEKSIPFLATKEGINLDFVRAFSVSTDAEHVWGIQITNSPKCKLVKMSFSTKETFSYNYEHQNLGLTVIIAEDLNFAMSRGLDKMVILHDLTTGETTMKIEMQIGNLAGLCRLGDYVAIADYNFIKFFDLTFQEEVNDFKIKTKGWFVNCMQAVGQDCFYGDFKQDPLLFVGGFGSNQLTRIEVPRDFLRDEETGK